MHGRITLTVLPLVHDVRPHTRVRHRHKRVRQGYLDEMDFVGMMRSLVGEDAWSAAAPACTRLFRGVAGRDGKIDLEELQARARGGAWNPTAHHHI
jgi:hypothetical protein